jgi:SAM-dependent methyltransferase
MTANKTLRTALMVSKNIILGGNLAALTMLKRPRDLVRYVGESLLLYRSVASRRGIPQRNVYEVLSREGQTVEQIILGNLSNGGSWLTTVPAYTMDIVSLCLICQLVKPRTIFEIGTLTGYTAFHFALNTPDDSRIVTLDLPKEGGLQPQLSTDYADDTGIDRHARARAYCFEETKAAKKIQTVFGDSATFDFAPYAGQIDFFFIDGAHSYEYVRSDTMNALRCCHRGSVIAWHDFGRVVVDGVARWVKEFGRTHDVYTVPGGSLAFTVLK